MSPEMPAAHEPQRQLLGYSINISLSAAFGLTQVIQRRTKADWAVFVQDIATNYPDAERITRVMDNLNTHTPASLY